MPKQEPTIGDQFQHLTISDIVKCLVRIECWRTIKDFPKYRVSSHGRVSGLRVAILTPGLTVGYEHVSLRRDGQTYTVRVAKLVADAFLGGPPFENAEVAHNDGVRNNNRLDNIRWTNSLDNMIDKIRHNSITKGSDVKGAKLKEKDIPDIFIRASRGELYKDIADEYGVSISTVSLIKLKKTWRHVSIGGANAN